MVWVRDIVKVELKENQVSNVKVFSMKHCAPKVSFAQLSKVVALTWFSIFLMIVFFQHWLQVQSEESTFWELNQSKVDGRRGVEGGERRETIEDYGSSLGIDLSYEKAI
jgi:hypothetical protein